MTRGGWGDGTLTPVSDGKWKLRLPPYLGRGQVTFRAANKTEAKKEQRRILDRAYREKFDPQTVAYTFDELCEYTLGRYQDQSSMKTRSTGLATAREAFGHMRADTITHETIERWERTQRARLAPWTMFSYITSVKTVFNDAVRRGLLAESPAKHIKNPTPGPSQINPFETLQEVEAVAAELPPEWRALPMFACASGLRVEEWLALERGDIRDGMIYVNKRYADGTPKPGTKNGDPERRVTLTALAAEALRRHPTRLDTRLLFPHADGDYLNYDYWSRTVWKDAVCGVRGCVPPAEGHTAHVRDVAADRELQHLDFVEDDGYRGEEFGADVWPVDSGVRAGCVGCDGRVRGEAGGVLCGRGWPYVSESLFDRFFRGRCRRGRLRRTRCRDGSRSSPMTP
jgi:integrase